MLMLFLVIVLLGCDDLGPPSAVEQFEVEIRNLEEAWRFGGQTRQSLLSKDLPVDRAVCQRMYKDTTADEAADQPGPDLTKEFARQHQAYFVNGCLGIGKPNPSGATPTPAATPTAES